ncbi:hypothetical protein [Wolbachia endosymbiont of Brugia pahangi]|uniref:hypothetical protein n=1 Tax=Wolbachia endosymbiont of Brugia pahangi TaxID=96495 RepID=UPI0014359C97|nr:hypothetical protein [Wolbachia endosymbiont of Brugia pahangi]QIT36021.1 hypothetical protein WBP_0641 [Wolbachia endosymbiont of Brugia pahangi]
MEEELVPAVLKSYCFRFCADIIIQSYCTAVYGIKIYFFLSFIAETVNLKRYTAELNATTIGKEAITLKSIGTQ